MEAQLQLNNAMEVLRGLQTRVRPEKGQKQPWTWRQCLGSQVKSVLHHIWHWYHASIPGVVKPTHHSHQLWRGSLWWGCRMVCLMCAAAVTVQFTYFVRKYIFILSDNNCKNFTQYCINNLYIQTTIMTNHSLKRERFLWFLNLFCCC